MTPAKTATLVVAVSGGLTTTTVAALVWTPGGLGPLAAASIVCWAAFSLWPWAVLPAGVIGATLVSGLLGITDVKGVVALHVLCLATGAAGLITRWFFVPGANRAAPPLRRQLGMASLAGLTIVAALYGLAAGNAPDLILVAAYQVGVIPVYFFLTVHTLSTPRALRNAAALYTSAICGLTLLELTEPGRHGGLLSLLAVPPLIVLAGRTTGWRRAGLAVVAAVLGADVILASYRGIWIAGGIALAILVLRGGTAIHRGVAATAGAGAAAFALAAVIVGVGFNDRSSAITTSLDRPAGYRIPESLVGLDAFASRPLFGAGLGQTTPHTYLPGFMVTDVGPVYHAFYVLLLANLGVFGLCVVLWPILRLVWRGLSDRDGLPLAFAALTCGYLAAATVSSPMDGHWELGLLPALVVVTASAGVRPRREHRQLVRPLWTVDR